MIANLIRWSLKDRLFILAAAALLLGYGGYRALQMPVDVFPDLTAPTVTVLAEAPGLAPVEMEALVSIPIETALNGAAGVRRIRSSTSIGAAIVWVDFDWDMDIFRARQIVAERLQSAMPSLPPDMAPPVLAPVASIMGEIMYVGLISDRHDLMTLKTEADWTLRRQLLAVPGVAQVTPTGGDSRQYQVLLDPVKLANYGLGLDQVRRALSETNENTSAGFTVDNGQEYLIYGLGRVQSADDIAATVVDRRGNLPVRVADVAEVRIGPAIRRGAASANGEPAVVLAIQKQPDANTLALTARLDQTPRELQSGLPAGMMIETELFRQADFIELAVRNVEHALRDGAILLVLIVFTFIWSASATIITALAIPLSLLTAVRVLEALGASVNTMTLGGMAIAVGALVDDAIIATRWSPAALAATHLLTVGFLGQIMVGALLQLLPVLAGVPLPRLFDWVQLHAAWGPFGWIGLLILVVGFGLPSGMLFKIVPFLCWFHLQSRQLALGRMQVRIPHMHRLLPDAPSRWQAAPQVAAVLLSAAGLIAPSLAAAGGLMIAVSASWLLALLGTAVWRYRKASRALNSHPTSG